MIKAGTSIILCLAALVGCQPGLKSGPEVANAAPAGGVEGAPAPLATARLEGGFPTLWHLCDSVLRALESRDAATLQALRITETEYKEHVFPEFPQAGPGNSIPADFHWFHLDLRSRSGLLDALDSFGGLPLELAEIVVTQGVDEYASYRIHKKVELKVKFPDGHVEQIKVFGSVVEMDGTFKILAFPT